MKKNYLTPQVLVLNMEVEIVLAASVVMGDDGRDNVEFETRKRSLIWGEKKS